MSGLAYRHQRVLHLRQLVNQRSAREQEGRFVLEGPNLLEEALKAGTHIEAIYVDGGWAAQAAGPDGGERYQRPAEADDRGEARGRIEQLLARAHDTGTPVFELGPGVLARVADTVTPQPVMVVAIMPRCSLGELAARHPQLVVVCVDVRDPGNAGTVARSAWAAGADAVICCQGTADPWGPKAVRSSAGAVLHLPVVSAGTAPVLLDELASWGLRRWGSVPSGGQDYAAADLSRPSAIVLGNEASGLPLDELGAHLDGLVSIPMSGGAESLNVGMAGAVLCFEASRQRRLGSGPAAG